MGDTAERRLAALATQLGVTQRTTKISHIEQALQKSFPGAENARVFPPAVHDGIQFDKLLAVEELRIKNDVRAFMESKVAPIITDYWERAEFPHHLVPSIGSLGIGGLSCKLPNEVKETSLMAAGCIVAELARVDCSLSTFLLVHSSLAMTSIEMLGSMEQKMELLPKMAALELVGCFALTEPDYGSDAAALTTTAKKVDGGYVIHGQKRWIGNGTFANIFVVWARNEETDQVNAFIVRAGSKGLQTSKIRNKTALRCVQNADIVLDNVFIPDHDRLPKVQSFKDTSKVLAVSRVMVAWQPVGIVWGVYDMCVRYTKQRRQFGVSIASFQLVQERLSRMQANIQLDTHNISRQNEIKNKGESDWSTHFLIMLQEQGVMTHGIASNVKAWNTLRGRETVALGRELLGGNGVTTDFHVAKAFSDLEALYTYEGTYDINSLVSGREITSISAIKPRT